MIKLKYRILPYLIELYIPGFGNHFQDNFKTLSISDKSTSSQFELFGNRILNARGKEFLPVMRMSDGEYQFILGDQPPSFRNTSMIKYLGKYLKFLKRSFFDTGGFSAATLPGVSSGNFSNEERKNALKKYGELVKRVSNKGILALHLTFNQKPFQERFHPNLKEWMEKNDIKLTEKNYVPFYFVYALFRGAYREELFKNQRVLVIHGATGEKQERIITAIKKLSAKDVIWHQISSDKSFYDVINTDHFVGNVDIVVIGAGIGKPNILMQLEPLSVPCIDVGFIFEIWADDDKKWLRTFTVPDDEWDDDKIKFR